MSTQPMINTNNRIVIIGGGISGLTLAQALRRHGTPCTIFEREESSAVRKQGWALTIQWSLVAMEAHFLPEIFDRVCAAQVNPEDGRDSLRKDPWVNGLTGRVEQTRPESKRFRLKRYGIREALMEGLDVKWGKQLVHIERLENGIRAEFSDGSTATGDILVGADGSVSVVRKALAPTTYPAHHLPISTVAATVPMTEEQYRHFRDNIDPLYFMGTHPETDTFLFWSLLDMSRGEGQPYRVQVFFSWLKSDDDQDGEMSEKHLLEVFKKRGKPFFAPLGGIIASLPRDTQASIISVVDWPLVEWDNWEGRCTLIGDAAHCMTPYRGEGVNHAIVDACQLADMLKMAADGQISTQDAVKQYEEKMRPRAVEAVGKSRKAGLDAHSYSLLDAEGSVALFGRKGVES